MTDGNITDNRPDFLSALALQILNSRPDAYRKLVVNGTTPAEASKLLGTVAAEKLLSVPVKNSPGASAMLAGLWLWHDALHECHEIVQDLIGPTGSFWHAIMHRREGDFSNAKYWYARCVDHRAGRLISAMARDVVGRKTADSTILRIVGGEYNSQAFVDLVSELDGTEEGARYEAAVRIQQLEWKALFHYCAYEAAGAEGGMI